MAKFPCSLGRFALFIGTLAIVELFVVSCSRSGGVAKDSGPRSKAPDATTTRSVPVKSPSDPAETFSTVGGSSTPVPNIGANAPDPKKDFETCNTNSRPDSVEAQIAACTRVINARGLSRNKLVRAYISRGFAYNELFLDMEHNHSAEAITDLSEAIRLRSNVADAFFGRGNSYSDMGFENKALADYSRAIELYPAGATLFRKGDAFNNRGVSYEYDGKGNFQRAIADFSEVIRLNPKDWGALCNRSHAYHKIGKDALADADRRKANRLNGSDRLIPFSSEMKDAMKYGMTCQ